MRLKNYPSSQLKGLVLFLNGSITMANADAVNDCINGLVPLPLIGVRMLHGENIDITNDALIIAQLYKSVQQLGFSDPASIKDRIIEERFSVPEHSISCRLFGII